jgi:hypothetical protein
VVLCLRAALLAVVAAACDPVATPILALSAEDAGMPAIDAQVLPDAEPPDAGQPETDSGSDAMVAGPLCGDGVQQEDEYCDDYGNSELGSGCNDTCSGEVAASCGDDVVTEPEVCDGASAYCNACQELLGSCGDGALQVELEDCDSAGASETCDGDCSAVICGDGVVNAAAGERCDDGRNDGTPGSCSTDCRDYALGADSAAAQSCAEISSEASGFYWLLTAGAEPYVAYCDAGWTLVMRAVDANFDYYDPLWSNDALENAEDFAFDSPGRSKYRSYVEVSFDALRTTDVDDFSRSFSVATAHPSALALFGANGGEGFGLSLASGPDALEPYFDDRVDVDHRHWGCRDFIHVGLNLHALLGVTDGTASSANPVKDAHCDWDGGARFGQRVNTCNYVAGDNGVRQCSGNHNGQGWGNFQNRYTPLRAALPIRQLLWVR